MGGSAGAIAGIAGGAANIAGSLFGSKKGTEAGFKYNPVAQSMNPLMQAAGSRYLDMYNKYYWPIEEQIASYYKDDLTSSRPYDIRMRDYLLNRGDELVQLASDTNAPLDENKKSLIRRLIEGEDVLADRYRSQASTDVGQAFGQQRQQLMDSMQRAGVNPNSGAFASNMSSLASNEALASASARTNASRLAEDTSLARQADALNYYTYPQREQYDVGPAPTPGLGLGQVMQGVSGGSMYQQGTQDRAGGDLYGGIGALIGGLDKYFSKS